MTAGATELARERERLRVENRQLQRAVSSHALVDQAIGAVIVLGRIRQDEAWGVLRDVSQRTNTKLSLIAEHVLKFAQGGDLPQPELDEFRRALERNRIGSRTDR
ncbi:ANTAR domain-containing protein [Streptomyces sp. NPDC004393]|uniref:ANTAR domain-containing protein n=1 Tax=Streptomyces sp. NPDC004533 TaxID=3154278 RepID=UPI0033B96472